MQLEIDGRTIHCHTGDTPFDPALPTVVLVHGALNDHSVWRQQSRALAARGYAVLAPDLPGHGRSSGPALRSVEALADWLLALLDAADVPRALLAGHSMGSLVVLEAAHRAPPRAAGLALLGATLPMNVAEALLTTALLDVRAAIDMVVAWSHAPSSPDPSVADAARSLMRRLADGSEEPLLHIDLAACNAYTNGAAAAGSVTCPVVLVQGTMDKMTPPRKAGLLTDAIPQATIVTVEAGHAMLQEAPEAVLDALLAQAMVLAS
ncbi:alpha/beta hydrolase [Massilia aurea]|uniref:alpha/beta fold hydrolase n=1 Tax=Massilia aurea TaxID=373040 RepID=UPI0034626EED